MNTSQSKFQDKIGIAYTVAAVDDFCRSSICRGDVKALFGPLF